MLALHIFIALASLIFAGAALVRPSQKIVAVGYGFIISTIASGTVLLLLGYSALHVCAAGFVYSLVAISMVAMAQKRLATFDV